MMETNFFGQAMMIRRVLPLMRENGGGKIVLFSSVNGVLAVPYQGAYTASKHAVEGFAEALRMEVSPFGISVCVVEPGDHRSGSSKYRRHSVTDSPDNPYYQDYQKTVAKIDHDEKNGSDPDHLGRVIARALAEKAPSCPPADRESGSEAGGAPAPDPAKKALCPDPDPVLRWPFSINRSESYEISS